MKNILTLLILSLALQLSAQTSNVKITQEGFGQKHGLRVFIGGELQEVNAEGEIVFTAEMEITQPLKGRILNKNNRYSAFYIEPGATEVVVSKKGFPSSLKVDGSNSHAIYASIAHSKEGKNFYHNTLKFIDSPIALEVFNSKFKFRKLSVEELKNVYDQTSDENKKLLSDLKGFLNTVGMDKIEVGGQIIDFEGLDAEELKYKTKDYRGKYLLLDFAATGCGPCWTGYPDMIDVTSKYENLQVITYNEDSAIETWNKIAKQRDIVLDWPVLWNGDNKKEIFELYKVEGWPLHYLISPEGEVLETWFGSGGEKLNNTLKKHIK